MKIEIEDIRNCLDGVQVEDLEQIKADWFDKDCIIQPDNYLYRYNYKGRRYYIQFQEDGFLIAPSQTTVYQYCAPENPYLTEWKVRYGLEKAKWLLVNSANYGTFFHVMCGNILRGQSVVLNDDILFQGMKWFYELNDMDFVEGYKWYKEEKRNIKKDLYGFVRWCYDYKVKPLAIEYPLMDPDGEYACTIDIVCELTIPLTKKEEKEGVEPQEITAMVDIKSGLKGFYESNEIQLVADVKLWNMWIQDTKVSHIFNYGCKNYRLPLSSRVTPYHFKDQTATEYAYKWPLYLQLFHGDPANKPSIQKTEFRKDAVLSINEEPEVFENIDLIEQIKKGE